MTWFIIKNFFKKAWNFVVKYWKYLVGLIYGIFVWLYFSGKFENVKDILKIEKESHEKEVDLLNEIHEDEIEERDIIIEKYIEVLEKIEKEYKLKRKNLENEKKKEIKKLVKDNINNPGELAKLISEKFDIIYVESGEIK